MERVISGAEARELIDQVLLDTPLDRPSRPPGGAEDWGDNDTIKLFVKRKSKSWNEFGDHDWGQWMGSHEVAGEQKLVILTRRCGTGGFSPTDAAITGLVLFDTREEMMAEFWLD